jgi:hypothetical protein
MTPHLERADLGSARVPRAGESVALSRTFRRAPVRAGGNPMGRLFRRDAKTSTRDACAPPIMQ